MAAQTLYLLGQEKIFEQSIAWATDTIKVALVTSSYTPNQDTHDYWDDVVANEVSGTGYSAGGETLTSPTVTSDAGTNEIRMDAADVAWSGSTITARYAVIYKATGVNATSPLISYINFSTDQATVSGTFTLTFATNSVFKATVA